MRSDTFDLTGLRLHAGEARRLDVRIAVDPFQLAGERYPLEPPLIDAHLEISRTTGSGYALRLRFEATLAGPCMRCLEPATQVYTVDTREISQQPDGSRAAPSGEAGRRAGGEREAGEELDSPYVEDGTLDLRAWARDALALALPAAVLCRPDCAGLCPVCGIDLNGAGSEHHHEREPDARWSKLSELRFD